MESLGGPLGPLKARQVNNGVRAGVAEMVKVGVPHG